MHLYTRSRYSVPFPFQTWWKYLSWTAWIIFNKISNSHIFTFCPTQLAVCCWQYLRIVWEIDLLLVILWSPYWIRAGTVSKYSVRVTVTTADKQNGASSNDVKIQFDNMTTQSMCLINWDTKTGHTYSTEEIVYVIHCTQSTSI